MYGRRSIRSQTQAPRVRAAPFRCRLVVMAKAPVAGRVKTRLARDLGVATATRFARHSLPALLARVTHPGAWQTIVALDTATGMSQPVLPAAVSRMGQGRGDLGQRMHRIMMLAPPGPVVIIGTDVPATERRHIARAFRLLGGCDAVFGPASDGGYWLVGLRRRPKFCAPFRGVRWSTQHALADTLANLRGLSIGWLPTLSDIDTGADLAAAGGKFGRRVGDERRTGAPPTN